jgi:hypothetical protein
MLTERLNPLFSPPPPAKVKRQKVALPGNRRHVSRIDRRKFIKATEHVDQLPAAGEAIHGVMAPNYDAWMLLTAISDLAAPATIRHLTAATLGFSRKHGRELLEALDSGRIGSALLVVSHYFKSVDPTIFQEIEQGLSARGQRAVVLRSHCKLLLAKLTDGRQIVVETSANLRTSNNVEQWTMSDSRELLEFHQAWIDELIRETARAAK